MKWIYLFLVPFFIHATDLIPDPTDPPPSEEITTSLETTPIPSALYKKQFIHTLVIIVCIVLGALLFIWLMRKFSKALPHQINHKKNIKILERREISPNTSLYHMQIGSKQFIISESKCEVCLITTLDWEEPEAP